MLMDYHKSLSTEKIKSDGNSKTLTDEIQKENMCEKVSITGTENSDGKFIKLEKNSSAKSVNSQFLSEKYIEKNGLVPEKVLNIFHMMDDEKNLVAYIKFKNRSNPAYVSASWANINCAELVIQFYEGRIYWQHQPSGELTKAEYM